ncbi:unnamed protein product [marine sediment metagenome]|uniref:Uncharacterized protein n=1 Tax=marine sediment metagenome TaxID=412755 RepID=X0VWQ4_9ZZZZ
MNENIYNELKEFIEENGFVCPMPMKWNELYEMLPNRKRKNGGWEPSLPLILGAWESPILFKKLRFLEHIEYAFKNGVIEKVNDYLRSLQVEDWFKG